MCYQQDKIDKHVSGGQMSKQTDLETLDDNIRKLLIKATSEDGDTSILPELNTAIQYLAKNNLVAEKPKGSVEEDIKNRLDEAEKRRNKK